MFKGMNIIEFTKRFQSNEDCFEYLVQQKWPKGFVCIKCGSTQNVKGRTRHHRRCKSCKYDENVLANTVFHGTKMPLLKAFHMSFRLTAKKKGMSSIELGKEVGVQQKTAWLFKRKVQQMMKEDDIDGNADADEFLVGGYDSGEKGRSLSDKQAVLIVAEKLDDGRIGKIGLRHIENFEADTLKYTLKEMTKPTVQLTTDAYSSYKSLQSEMNLHLSNQRKEKRWNSCIFKSCCSRIGSGEYTTNVPKNIYMLILKNMFSDSINATEENIFFTKLYKE